MFKNVFSFVGRIRRIEYVITLIIFIIILTFINQSKVDLITYLIKLPIFYIMLAQGSKRCHDVDSSGWWQLFPFFNLYLCFAKGTPGNNEYGMNPKGETLQKDTNVLLNQEFVNVYLLPDFNSEIITKINKKEIFTICIDNNNLSVDWDFVKLSNERVGYIDAKTKVIISKK